MIIILRSRFQVEKSVYSDWVYGIDDESEWNITQEEALEVSARTFCGALPAPSPSPSLTSSPIPTSTLSSFFSQSVIWSLSSIVGPTGGSELSLLLFASASRLASDDFTRSFLVWSGQFTPSNAVREPWNSGLFLPSATQMDSTSPADDRSKGDQAVGIGATLIGVLSAVGVVLLVGLSMLFVILWRRQLKSKTPVPAEDSEEVTVTFTENVAGEMECENPLMSDDCGHNPSDEVSDFGQSADETKLL
jgi:hypothetical protein